MFFKKTPVVIPKSGSTSSKLSNSVIASHPLKRRRGNLSLKKWIKNPIFWVRFTAYGIPIAFLLYVLYMNFLPFGYHKSFTINVGSTSDTSGEFYLEPSKSLSERKTDDKGNTYRELNGLATAVFKPNAVLKNAEITVSVEGEGVSIIPPVIDFKPDEAKWDYAWDFTKGIPSDLKGNAFMFDGEATFNGKDTRLELPNSADKFEDGPFSVYAEWTPKDDQNNAQQIVGHYNWELWQNKNSVELRVGRMNDGQGPAYPIKYPVNIDFFDMKHSALAIYNPSDTGYIDFYVDGNFVDRTTFGKDKIWKDYNNDKNLSFGKSGHGVAKYFEGSLHQVNIATSNSLLSQSKTSFAANVSGKINIFVVSNAVSVLKQIKLNATQK